MRPYRFSLLSRPFPWAALLSLLVWALVGLAAWGFWELLLG
jgi:hypothetical protein